MKTNMKLIRPSSANNNNSRLLSSDQNTSLHNKPNPYKLPNQNNLPRAKPPNPQQISFLNNKPAQMEWERLYEESLQLKSLVNVFKDENIKLRTQNTNLQRDLTKCTKIIEEMENTGNMKRFYAKPSTDNQMILHFKAQLKELKEQLTEREGELASIKKSSKYTKLTEMEIEKKMFQDETIRLKSFLDELVQENVYAKQQEQDQMRMQELIEQRDNLIKQMQSDLEQYESESKNLQDKFTQLYQAYQDLDKQYGKLDQESKQKMRAKDKQIMMLKNDLSRLQVEQEKQKINNKQQSKQQQQYNYLQKPKPPQFSPNKLTDKSLQANNTSKNNTKRIGSAKQQQQQQQLIEEQQKPILLENLDPIIQEIKYKLIADGIQSQKIDQYLFIENSSETTVQQLQDKFIQSPFNLEKPQALQMSRFLIEKPGQQQAANHNQSQDNGLIRSLFFKTVGFWALYDQVEQKVIELSLQKLFDGLLSQFEKKFQRNLYSKQQFQNEITSILQEKGRSIRELESSYIISRIIQQSKNINQLKGSEFVAFVKDLLQFADKNEDITLDELQKYYENINENRNFFFYKQLRTKQEQMIALMETKNGVQLQQSPQKNDYSEQQGQQSTQHYLIKSGLVRSHSDPDPYQMQQMEDEDDEDYQQYEQDQFDQQQYKKQVKQQLSQQQQQNNDEDDENENDEDNYDQEYDQDDEQNLNNAKINYEDEDYNMNVDQVFDEDDEENENDQWEQVENTGNFPIRQDRQIPNSRPTSSYVNKLNKSVSDVKGSLVSEFHPTKEVQEQSEQSKEQSEEYLDEQFEKDES